MVSNINIIDIISNSVVSNTDLEISMVSNIMGDNSMVSNSLLEQIVYVFLILCYIDYSSLVFPIEFFWFFFLNFSKEYREGNFKIDQATCIESCLWDTQF